MTARPCGTQWTLTTDLDELCVVEVGGTLRSWRHTREEVLAGFAPDAPIDAGRGQHLPEVTAMGTTGAPVMMARRVAPLLYSPTSPRFTRVPPGNMMTQMP